MGADTAGGVDVFGAIAIIVAGVIVILQNRQQNRKVDKVNKTLTENNGGSHVKDQLDRIETQITSLHLKTESQGRDINRIEGSLNQHLIWSGAITEALSSRVLQLESESNQHARESEEDARNEGRLF